MQESGNLTVPGYVRAHYKDGYPDDIINIILTFYLIRIDSIILTPTEGISLLDALYDTLKQQEQHTSINRIDTDLLFRASDHEFSSHKFHDFCDKFFLLFRAQQHQITSNGRCNFRVQEYEVFTVKMSRF